MAWTLQTWRPEPMSYDPANQQAKQPIDPREMLAFQARQQAKREADSRNFEREKWANQQKASARSQYNNAAMMAARSGNVSATQLSSMQRTFGVDDQPQSPAERQAERLRRTDELLRRARLGNAQYDLKKQQQMRQTEADKANPNKGYENSRIEVQVMPGGPTRVLTGADTRLTDQKQGNFGMTQPGYQNLAGMNADVAQRYGQAPQPQQGPSPEDIRRYQAQKAYQESSGAFANSPEALRNFQQAWQREARPGMTPPYTPNMGYQPQPGMAPGAEATRALPQGMDPSQYAGYQRQLAGQAYPNVPQGPGEHGQTSMNPGLAVGQQLLTPGQHAYVQDKMGGYRMNAPMAEGPQVRQGGGYAPGPNIPQPASDENVQIQRLGGQWSRIAQDYAKGIRDANTPEGRQGMEADRQAQIAQFQQAVPDPQVRAKIAQFYGMDPSWIGVPQGSGPQTGAWQSPMGPTPMPDLSGLRSQRMPWDIFTGGMTPAEQAMQAARSARQTGQPQQQIPNASSYNQGVVGIPGYAEGINANYAANPGANQGRIDSFDAEIKAAQARLAPMQAEDAQMRVAQAAGGGEGGLPFMGNANEAAQRAVLQSTAERNNATTEQLRKFGIKPDAVEGAAIEDAVAKSGIKGQAAQGFWEPAGSYATRIQQTAERALRWLGGHDNPSVIRQAALRISTDPVEWAQWNDLAYGSDLSDIAIANNIFTGEPREVIAQRVRDAAKKLVDTVNMLAKTQPNAQPAPQPVQQ